MTSSFIPITKSFLGSFNIKLLKTATIEDGSTSLDDKPYLPPTTIILESTTDLTSKYSGSPIEPGSFVLSKTAILVTVFGKTSRKSFRKRSIKINFYHPYF